jgi:hypothetical protein
MSDSAHPRPYQNWNGYERTKAAMARLEDASNGRQSWLNEGRPARTRLARARS